MNSFNDLIRLASDSGVITTDTMSTVTEGTLWWLLCVRNANGNIAVNDQAVVITSLYKNFTPEDTLVAAMAQRQFDGLITVDDPQVLWSSTPVQHIPVLRQQATCNGPRGYPSHR